MANLRFQNALQNKAQNIPPIWFMRQAGRYHKHYQKLKEKHSFIELCKNPELAAQVALGPIEDFDFDVAILFSDLLFPLEALGIGLSYNPGPVLEWSLNSSNFQNLKSVDEAVNDLSFQKEAVKLTRELLPQDKSLIGFVGGPWTLFSYASKEPKKNLTLYSRFCEVITPLLIQNIQLQLDGGAEVVMIFDTDAGELCPMLFQQLVLPELKKLAQAHPRKLGYYSKGTQEFHLDDPFFYSQELAGLGVDHRWSMNHVLKNRKTGFIQGNFDQNLLFLETDDFKKNLLNYLEPIKNLSLQDRAGWVCGLGHGVLPQTPEKNVKLFIDTVREYFA